MPTQLTTPIAKNETQATLDGWSLVVVRNGSLLPDLTQTMMGATLSIRYADGSFSRRVDLTQAASQLNAGALTAVRNFHNALVSYLRAQGLLPAGTDTSDF